LHTLIFCNAATDYGAWGDIIREQKTDESEYRYSYQGQFSEKDLETGWSHFELREYDPVIGKWTSVDPYNQHWSGYSGMNNNALNNIDQNGGLDWYLNLDNNKAEWHDTDPGKGYSYLGDENYVFTGGTLPTLTVDERKVLERDYGALGVWFTNENSSSHNPYIMGKKDFEAVEKIHYGIIGAVGGGMIFEAVPAITSAYSSVAAEVDAVTTFGYVRTEIAANQVVNYLSRQAFRIGLRYVAPGTTGMKVLVEAHYHFLRHGMKRNAVNLQKPMLKAVQKLGDKLDDFLGN